jgi:hypothetical protein
VRRGLPEVSAGDFAVPIAHVAGDGVSRVERERLLENYGRRVSNAQQPCGRKVEDGLPLRDLVMPVKGVDMVTVCLLMCE